MSENIFILRIYIAVILLLSFCALTSAGAEKGPLYVRNQFPPHLMFLRPVPKAPAPVSQDRLSLSLSADYSSVFVNKQSDEWSALIDMEMTVLEFSLEYGMTEYLSLSLDAPLVSMNKGFLDGFLEDYHHALHVPNYGREYRPKDEFAYSIRKNGSEWFSAESGGLHPADCSITTKFRLIGEKERAFQRRSILLPDQLSLAYTLKLPAGDEDKGFGSGRSDHGFSLFSRFRFDPVALYLNPSVVFLADPETEMPIRNTLYGLFAGLEYMFSDSLSLSAQLNYYTSPFENTGIRHLDEETVELALGFTYDLSSSVTLEFAFCEDLSHSAPDFNLHLRLACDLTLKNE